MSQLYLAGCGTALVTPFDGENVDYDAYVATVKRQVNAGIDFLVPLGTTAETPCLSNEEKVKLLTLTVQNAGGRPILAGAGTNSLSGTLANIKLLSPYGADAFLIVTPYYNKPTQTGLLEYFTAVADASDKPIVIYNVPGRTGVNITSETTLKLAQHPNIIAIKEASSNYKQISEIIKGKPEGFSVLSGNDDETLSLMSTGAQGVISVASNVAPDLMEDLVRALKNDDMKAARNLHYKLMDLFKNCFIESNPIPVKAAMAQLGLMRNALRLPLTKASAKTEEIISQTLKDLL